MRNIETIILLGLLIMLMIILPTHPTNAYTTTDLVEEEQCYSDGDCYDFYLIVEWEGYNESYYTNYWYNWNTYKIPMPNTRQHFLLLLGYFENWTLSKNNDYYNTMVIHKTLLMYWMEGLIY